MYFQKSFQRNGYPKRFYLLVLFEPRINIKNIINRKNVSIYNFAQFRDYLLFVFSKQDRQVPAGLIILAKSQLNPTSLLIFLQNVIRINV